MARGGGGGAPIDNLGTLGDEGLINSMGLGGGGGGGFGSGQPTSNAMSGITSALSKGLSSAAGSIAGVNTMPNPVEGGPIPGVNQQAPTLVGRRPQTAFYG